MENITTAATQTLAYGGPLEELADSLAVSVDSVARHQLDIKRLTEHINALKKKGGAVTNGVPGTGENNFPPCKHYEAVGRTVLHRHNRYYFDPKKIQTRLVKMAYVSKRSLFQ